MKISTEIINKYIDLAHQRLDKTYSPYSNFPVSAVLLLRDGKYYTGVNIENVSFGATNCAERTAIFSAINDGYRKEDFCALFVIANTENAIAPCCICRQVFVEFFEPTMPVYLANREKVIKSCTVGDLVPYAFESLSM
jgi:cytidine deaminase, homotetrameric